MYSLEGKVVLVTGAASGIGAGVVKAFLEEGAKHVAILDVNEELGKAFEVELNTRYGKNAAKFYKCDVTTEELAKAYDGVIKENGYIDVVVNNAGICNDEFAAFEKQIAINVTALMSSSFKAHSLMRIDRGGKGGTIVNISSIVGLYHARTLPVYSASKSAVLQFSNCLGMDPHFSKSGVRVVTLCFGYTDTGLFDNLHAFDPDLDDYITTAMKQLPRQNIESAVNGLVHAYKHGESASTWLVTSGRPAKEITQNIRKAYEIMSQGVFD